ncbi:hypothetical protein LJB92_02165 [Bacteroidales bacterium OttesenSCG-928-M06]|nr:hypothetical protein [Bacteroidales bacterium OttesenSCG-928-M06]
MKKYYFLFLILVLIGCSKKQETPVAVSSYAVKAAIDSLSIKYPQDKENIVAGVNHVAKLWQKSDGGNDDFSAFCEKNYMGDSLLKKASFARISEYIEAIEGHYNEMVLQLQKNVQESTGSLMYVDRLFSGYNPATHQSEDFYKNKIAFFIALNFPKISLEDKESLGENRLAWAYSRMGDIYTSRIPAELKLQYSEISNKVDLYVANYNIYAGHLVNEKKEKIFPENTVLLSHWNLRDEIKANYNKGDLGWDKQNTIYQVMRRIITQEIPQAVINSNQYDWNPYTNEVVQNGKPISVEPEKDLRYKNLLEIFHALRAIDGYTNNTFIDRKFSEEMEISVEDTEQLLKTYLAAPELKKIGQMIQSRLGRDLQAFDIWYDGFKSRSQLDENKLSELTQRLYPNAGALEKDLPAILIKLGFEKERAYYLADKIEVDAARGSGHAWGAEMKGQKSHLRTRISQTGMDYKGYNIAIHEFGHNVEQTISLYDVDYYLLRGVPNTAFTEALAFVFQNRDLDILGFKTDNQEKSSLEVLDKAWQLYEIGGVSLLDISVWKWMYQNPEASPEQLKEATIRLAKEIWNEYYSPVFGVKDEPVLAIYSHMLSYPLYLSAYSFGQIIQFQLEEYLKDKEFAAEVDRIYRLGRLTPNQWMIQATGNPLSVEPLLKSVREIE